MNDIKRLFFGLEILSPWPSETPQGRTIAPKCRHLTLAFLGNIPYSPLKSQLQEFPLPPFQVGPMGYFDKCLFLPEKHPKVAAWHLHTLDNALETYQHTIGEWLQSKGYSVDKRPFLPHMTIARSPFIIREWKRAFIPLPFMISNIHLYESQGDLNYDSLWSIPFIPAFKELDHTADIAFLIQGESMRHLHFYAEMALAFKFPEILKFIQTNSLKDQLDDIIIALNDLISQADCSGGIPLKAVSFHGNVLNENNILTWVMIVDV